MELSLEQLQAFTSVVECGSFSAAARKLGKAQSSISGLINNLEIDTGFDLFDRSTKIPTLTPEGLALLNDVKAVMKSHRNLKSRIDNLLDKVESEISLAYDNLAIPEGLMMGIAAEFEQAFPMTSLMLLEASHKRAYQLIEQGKVNLAVAISQDDYPEQFAFRGICHVHYCTVAGAKHPLARLESVTPQDLAQYRHLRITDTQTGFRRFDSDLSTNIWYTNAPASILEMIRQGLGWAEMPLHAVQSHMINGSIVKLPTSHQAVSYPHCVDLIWPTEGAMGRCLQWLLQRITQKAAALEQRPAI
ncbi:LysR family transcriptional regulator [Bowmanella dokdonensis]|uniref:LysR family transcriptional regulator n=1 Tax=Bowmanella dokdonensis TaxID=751969 RepID=A0A939IQP9_9ALTE|nr:LysR family transcriptional regulator [Bowmanella dokdonensis]MBN7825284.1 LysR family transcriptional regulator [Bowmanella dokdonensis]